MSPSARFFALCLFAACALSAWPLTAAHADTCVLTIKCNVRDVQDPDKHFDATVAPGTLVLVTVTFPWPLKADGRYPNDPTYRFPPSTAHGTAFFGDYEYVTAVDNSINIEVFHNVADLISKNNDGITIALMGGIRGGPEGVYAQRSSQLSICLTDTTGKALSSTALPLSFDLAKFDNQTAQYYASYGPPGSKSPAFFNMIVGSITASIQKTPSEPSLTKPAPEKPTPASEQMLVFRLPLVYIRPGFVFKALNHALFFDKGSVSHPSDGNRFSLPGVSALIPNARDNSLVVYATADGLKTMRAIIRQLDIPAKRSP